MSVGTSTVLEPGGRAASREERKERKRGLRAVRTRVRTRHLVVALPGLSVKERAALVESVSRASIRVGESMEGIVAPFVVGVIVFPLMLAVPALWMVQSHAAQLQADAAALPVTIGCCGALLS